MPGPGGGHHGGSPGGRGPGGPGPGRGPGGHGGFGGGPGHGHGGFGGGPRGYVHRPMPPRPGYGMGHRPYRSGPGCGGCLLPIISVIGMIVLALAMLF